MNVAARGHQNERRMRARRVKRLKVCNDRANKSKSETHVSLAQQKMDKKQQRQGQGEREGEKSSRSRGRARPLDGQLSWQLPDWGVPAYTKNVCAKVRNK